MHEVKTKILSTVLHHKHVIVEYVLKAFRRALHETCVPVVRKVPFLLSTYVASTTNKNVLEIKCSTSAWTRTEVSQRYVSSAPAGWVPPHNTWTECRVTHCKPRVPLCLAEAHALIASASISANPVGSTCVHWAAGVALPV